MKNIIFALFSIVSSSVFCQNNDGMDSLYVVIENINYDNIEYEKMRQSFIRTDSIFNLNSGMAYPNDSIKIITEQIINSPYEKRYNLGSEHVIKEYIYSYRETEKVLADLRSKYEKLSTSMDQLVKQSELKSDSILNVIMEHDSLSH